MYQLWPIRTLGFRLSMLVAPQYWPSDLLPAFPRRSDQGLKHFSPQLEVDLITDACRIKNIINRL